MASTVQRPSSEHACTDVHDVSAIQNLITQHHTTCLLCAFPCVCLSKVHVPLRASPKDANTPMRKHSQLHNIAQGALHHFLNPSWFSYSGPRRLINTKTSTPGPSAPRHIKIHGTDHILHCRPLHATSSTPVPSTQHPLPKSHPSHILYPGA
jgi:hypothetical protein